MLKIRLTRYGKKKQPIYRIVVAEHTMPVKGKFIEILGFYNPKSKEMGLNKEKIEHWLKVGAKPSDTVAMILRKNDFKLSSEFQKPKRYVKKKKQKEEQGQKETVEKSTGQVEGEKVEEKNEAKEEGVEENKEELKDNQSQKDSEGEKEASK